MDIFTVYTGDDIVLTTVDEEEARDCYYKQGSDAYMSATLDGCLYWFDPFMNDFDIGY